VEVPQKYGDQDGLPWFAHYGGPSAWLSDAGQRLPWLRERLRLRDFGKLNLNTMRFPQVLAGLLDDPRVMSFQNGSPPDPAGTSPFTSAFNPSPGGTGFLPATGNNGETWIANAGGRDWWLSMLTSRDGGLDRYARSYATPQNVVLPGTPTAKPFMDFGSAPPSAARTLDDFERTLLRPMPAVGSGYLEGYEGTTGRRNLFELGQAGGGLGSNAEFSTRYRLLGKVLNNGTTRSNTYVAFIQTDFFEATDPIDHDGNPNTAPISQIGAKLDDSPGYRGVFVIDRSLALELLKRRDLPPSNPALVYPQGSQYRTYSFAREQGSDGRPTPTFDWKQLVLYRRVLDAQ
jgi:hypothetical protein